MCDLGSVALYERTLTVDSSFQYDADCPFGPVVISQNLIAHLRVLATPCLPHGDVLLPGSQRYRSIVL